MRTVKSTDTGRLGKSSEQRKRIDPRVRHAVDTDGERRSSGRVVVAAEHRRCPPVHGDDANEDDGGDGDASGDW